MAAWIYIMVPWFVVRRTDCHSRRVLVRFIALFSLYGMKKQSTAFTWEQSPLGKLNDGST